jgi:hypothetical protein
MKCSWCEFELALALAFLIGPRKFVSTATGNQPKTESYDFTRAVRFGEFEGIE